MSWLSFSLVIFRVYLRRFYTLVSQHGTDRFDGYAVGEEHRRGCRVAALMPRDMLGDAATLGDGTDSGKARVVVGNGENPAVLAQTPVFVDDALSLCRAGGYWTPRPSSGG